uniref:Uncharacterized protein n=1 Tax=Biomphalaria glabrata TaxID=6526 RepID=A0A2C9KGX5_BIOGL
MTTTFMFVNVNPGHIIFVMDTSPSKTVWSLVLLDSQMPASKFSLPRYFHISSVNSSNTYWQVRLNQTIDVENIFHLTGVVIHSIDVKLSCFDTATQQYANYSRSIKVKHVSEFPPRFEPNIKLHIAELETSKLRVDWLLSFDWLPT